MMRIFPCIWICIFLPSVIVNAQVSERDLAKIDATVNKAFEIFRPAGLAVAIVSDSTIIYHKALGYSNKVKNIPLKTTSLFNIASCTKAFTAAAIGILVDEGKLKWTDKVTDYIPEFRLSDDYITRELTVEDLLCHRSGLGTFYGDLLWYNSDYSDAEVMNRMRYEKITRRFGIEYGYQNIMFMIAGDIVEKVTGSTWSEFVASRIFKPLGMNQTRPSNDELVQGQDIAMGHLDDNVIETYDFNAAKPAAGIYSSVDEMALWTSLLLNRGSVSGKRILSGTSLERILEPHTVLNRGNSQKQHGISFYMYGMGWFLFDYAGFKIAEHDGGMPGYISKVTLIPEKKISIIVLNNGNEEFVDNAIRGDLMDIFLKGKDYDWTGEYSETKKRYKAYEEKEKKDRLESRIPGSKPSLAPDGYTGTFRDTNYGDATISLENNKLRLTFLPTKKVFYGDLEHWHFDTFKVEFQDKFLTFGLITFNFDSSGKVTGFKIDLPSPDFHFWNLDFRKI